MKNVAKYNTFKGVSTVLTMGTPIVTLCATSSDYIYTPEGAVSFTGILVILLSILLLKDKIADQWKAPSAFVVSIALFVIILVVENILQPIKYVCLTTSIMSGIDEVTFKTWYKRIESVLPEISKYYKHVGFIFTTTDKLKSLESDTNV